MGQTNRCRLPKHNEKNHPNEITVQIFRPDILKPIL